MKRPGIDPVIARYVREIWEAGKNQTDLERRRTASHLVALSAKLDSIPTSPRKISRP